MLQKLLHSSKKKDLLRYAVVALGILGMGCILLSSFIDDNEETAAETQSAAETPEEYRLRMQEDLTELLSSVEGVGQVQVLITVKGSEEYHYATEGSSLITDEQVKNSSAYVTIGGSSKEQALIESITNPAITGVVIACEGGDRSSVQESVYHAVSVACGISTAQIYVTKLNHAGS